MTTGQQQSDPLIRAVLGGEPAALDAFYRREYPHVYRVCFGFLLEANEAEDAAQDAMLHLIDRLKAYDPSRRFESWRNAVTANLCRDKLRRKAARRRAEDAAAEEAARGAGPLPADPLDEAAQSEVQEIVRSSLGALSEREREVFVLRDLEGLGSPEVAEALGITEGTVRSLLSLARRRLRRILGERIPGIANPAGPGELHDN
ncbi:MAG: sigma-70 family RNA polymerase sigma factor [Planctomycetes bacterium]|nr:sigma-70 family RNA polymerase sigma factor [Planctomycetota bacterium]